jgi:hypothetical protein
MITPTIMAVRMDSCVGFWDSLGRVDGIVGDDVPRLCR